MFYGELESINLSAIAGTEDVKVKQWLFLREKLIALEALAVTIVGS
jgi:hypothetical protein